MKRRRNWITASLFVGLLIAAPPADAEKPDGQDPNRCAHLEGKPVYKKSGFSHVVRVRNTCTEVVTCRVWTNVDESHPVTLDVPAHAEREAVTRDGSPVSAFRANGDCNFPEPADDK